MVCCYMLKRFCVGFQVDINKSIVSREKKEAKTIKDGMRILKSIDEALKDTGECVGLTMGAVSLIQIVDLIVKNFGGDFSMSTAIWSANQVDINRLHILKKKGFISDCKFLMDPSVYTRKKEVVGYLHEKFDGCVVTTSTHAKFVTLRNDEYSFTILSSMNFTHNPRLEQYHITSCDKTCVLFEEIVSGAFESSRDSKRKDGRKFVDKDAMTKIVGNESYNPDNIKDIDHAFGEYA